MSAARAETAGAILVAMGFSVATIAFAETGAISVVVREQGDSALLPCRAWLDAGGERLFAPSSPGGRPYDRDRSFSCDGRFSLDVPVGSAVIHVERGKEYLPVDKPIHVTANQPTQVEISLVRWVHMKEEGWYSGDLHCHFGVGDITVLRQLALADDVNYEPISTLWNHQRRGLSDEAWPDWPSGPSVYADSTHLVALRNQEIERIGGGPFESVGALLMFGLNRPVKMPPGNDKYPCDAVLGRFAKKTSPECVIDTDKPIWGENVVGVALGLFDCVQVCHNHYHRAFTLVQRNAGGAVGWGMATPPEPDADDWGLDELFHRTNRTYYRFLNCGFRLAATGGSAMGVMDVPLGYNRTYAKLDGPLTEANYLKAIHSGQTFATSGPMLILTADGLDCGAKIAYPAGRSHPIDVRAELRSIEPVDSLEIVYNGQVAKRIALTGRQGDPVLKETVAFKLKPDRSGWVAARAFFKAPDGRLRQAHTSPIYVEVDGKPIAFKADAEWMVGWIDRLIEVSNRPGRYPSDQQRGDVQAVFAEARAVYERIAEQAKRYWSDG